MNQTNQAKATQSALEASGKSGGIGRHKAAYLSHPSSLLHHMGAEHPESPERVRAVHEALSNNGLMEHLDSIEAPFVTDEQILRVHTEAHLNRLNQASPQQGMAQLDADTAMNEHSLKAARHAAGALVKAVELVTMGGYRRVFCNVRPPGHHAESNQSMGFCLLNSVAIGAAHALSVGGLKRVAIVDFDVHHGNGTEDIFASEPRVVMVSTFQTPLYPGSGKNPLGPNMHNVGLEPGSGGDALKQAVLTVWQPALEAFKPDLLLVSAGFDAHEEDPLAQLQWTEQDYAWVTKWLVEQSERWCAGRIISTLEGGYALPALGRSAAAHVGALIA